MRLISFALTTEQIRQRTKHVTRRLGWKNLKPGTLLMACEKVMGRQGKPLVRLAVIAVTMVTLEALDLFENPFYAKLECEREGFPEMTGDEFRQMFCDKMGCKSDQVVTRIEFRYVPGGRMS